MKRRAKVGISRDFLDKDGNWFTPGSGVNGLQELGTDPEVFSTYLPEVTPQQIRGLDIVINLVPKWTRDTLADNEQMLAVLRRGVGYDNVDVAALTDAGVALTITRNTVRRPVAITYMTFMLALSTRLLLKDKLTRDGRWAEKSKLLGYGLVGRTLGAIGVGNIGREVFKLAMPFGMKHIAYDPYVSSEAVADVGVKLVGMDTVLSESDFLNINCPLNEDTHHLVSERELRKMKKTAFLINAARGPIVDETALIEALQEGWIQGAALDVYEKEPTPPDNPLLKMDNVIVTPHGMSHTDQNLSDGWNELLAQVSSLLSGSVPEGVVNEEVLRSPRFRAKFDRFLEETR